MNATSEVKELWPSQDMSNFSKSVFAPEYMHRFTRSLSSIEESKLQRYIASPMHASQKHHRVVLTRHTLSFETEYQTSFNKVVLRNIRIVNDSAIKRSKLSELNRDSGTRNYVIAEEVLKGVDGGKVSLEERKEAGKRLDDKFQFSADESYGWVRDSDLLKYKEYLWIILSTQSGKKLANIRSSGKVTIILFNYKNWNSSYGHDRVQMNIHPSQSQRYSEAFGNNTFVQLGGIRTLAHELTHAYYRDTGRDNMMEREEIAAMKLSNRIMREIYGLDAGERKSYATTPPELFPSEMIILK